MTADTIWMLILLDEEKIYWVLNNVAPNDKCRQMADVKL